MQDQYDDLQSAILKDIYHKTFNLNKKIIILNNSNITRMYTVEPPITDPPNTVPPPKNGPPWIYQLL